MCRVRTTRVAVSAGCGFPARCTSFASCAMILDAGGEADENDDDDDEEEEEEEEEEEDELASSFAEFVVASPFMVAAAVREGGE